MQRKVAKLFQQKRHKNSPYTTTTHTKTPQNCQQQDDNNNGGRRTIQKSSLMKQIHPSPSLIRRARVIRRRTTNIYCDMLKKLKEEDAVLISQILIIKLKPRSEASPFECSCIANKDIQMVPSVDFACPQMGSNATQFSPQFFYPDFMKGTVQRREDREAYQVILTNDRAERTFAFCFKFLTQPQHSSLCSVDSGIETLYNIRTGAYSVLVFISPYPQESLFHELAGDFVNAFQKDANRLVPMCRDLLQLRLTTSETSVKCSKYVLGTPAGYGQQMDKNSTAGTHPSHWTRTHVSTILEKVGIENAILVFLSLLAERRVIITGSNVTDVSRTVQAFVHLLAPLEWPHTLIPIVPDSQIDLFFNPTPYICGVLRYNLSRISELVCPPPVHSLNPEYALNDGITVMDVERGMILPPISRPDRRIGLKTIYQQTALMGFPRAAVCDLLCALKCCLPVKDPERTDYKIQKRVMIWYAKLFGHYRTFGHDISSARNRKLFASAHPCAETRLFLAWFIENGLLQYFISTQTESTAPSSATAAPGGLWMRFQKVLKKYAPPVAIDGEGRRRSGPKSLLWKVFTR